MEKIPRKLVRDLEPFYYKIRIQFIGKYSVSKKDSKSAFNDAIVSKLLSIESDKSNHARNYMYMQTINGTDRFKHITTRQYLKNFYFRFP